MGGDAAEVRESAGAALDNILAFVDTLVKAMDADRVGCMEDYGLGAATNESSGKTVVIMALVGDERVHGRGQRQNIGRSSDIGIPAWAQMKDDRSASWLAERMDRATTARAADFLIMLAPLPPEAQR